MNIDDMITVLEAAKRGERIEYNDPYSGWRGTADPTFDFGSYDYRIAPKPQMTLVEELRNVAHSTTSLHSRAADRIIELEGRPFPPTIDQIDTDKLLAELKRRTSC